MQQGTQAGSAFALLHGEAAQIIPLERKCKDSVVANLGDRRYWVGFDYRDQRTLLTFDGALPPQGLPRTANVTKLSSTVFVKSKDNTRDKSREEEWPMPENFRLRDDGWYELVVHRYAILAPACELLLCRFRPENFGLQYVFTEVRRKGEYSQVTWRFHSP